MDFVATLDISPILLIVAAYIISAVSSTGGLSGAFLLLPFQVSVLHFTSPAVSATNHLFNVIATPGGVIRLIREGRMLWNLALILMIGSIPGILVGTYIRVFFLPAPSAFKVFAGFVLLLIALQLLRNIFQSKNKNKKHNAAGSITSGRFSFAKIEFSFQGNYYQVSSIRMIIISSAIGLAGGTYGIGGGAMISPILVSIFNLPVYAVAGACLLSTFFTSFFAVISYLTFSWFHPELNINPEWILGFFLGIGGIAGTYTGAALQRFINATVIKIVLTIIMILVGLLYISVLFR